MPHLKFPYSLVKPPNTPPLIPGRKSFLREFAFIRGFRMANPTLV